MMMVTFLLTYFSCNAVIKDRMEALSPKISQHYENGPAERIALCYLPIGI